MQLSLQEVAPAERLPEDSAMFLAKDLTEKNWILCNVSFTIHLLFIYYSSFESRFAWRCQEPRLRPSRPKPRSFPSKDPQVRHAMPSCQWSCFVAELCQDALPEPTRATAKKKRGEPRGEAEMDQKAVEDAWLYTFWKCASLCFVVILISQSRNLFQLGFEWEFLDSTVPITLHRPLAKDLLQLLFGDSPEVPDALASKLIKHLKELWKESWYVYIYT